MFFARKGDYFQAGECLGGKINGAYRLHESDKKLHMLGFKVLKRSLLRLYGKRFDLQLRPEGELALLDEVPTTQNGERIAFIERVLGKKVKLYLAKEELMGYPLSFINRTLLLVCILLHSVFLIPYCFFSGKRVFHALALYYVIESILSLYHLKRKGMKVVVLSNIYSHDSNINYLIFSREGIRVIKNPSEDALAFDNSILLTDELIICNPYQLEEIKIIDTVKTRSVIHGLPEQTGLYESKYGNTFFPPARKVIGYYSSGSWLRKQYSRYYFHLDVDCALQEELLLVELKNFILKNPGYYLKIFMHPVEKITQKDIDLSESYYKGILSGIDFTYNDLGIHTCLSFEACDIAISLLSGSSLYRLVFGYKSLFYVPEGSFPTFPYRGSSLDRINIGTKPDFNAFLKDQMDLNEEDFFNLHGLEKYRYREICNLVGSRELMND